MERQHTSTVINVHEHLYRGTETIVPYLSHAGRDVKLSLESPVRSQYPQEKTAKDLRMEIDTDVEMMFKWLVDDFDLRSVCLYDIDGYEVDGREVFPRGGKKIQGSVCKKQGRIRQNCHQKDVMRSFTNKIHFSYSEVIERCLKEKDEVQVRYIYKWISERFPGFKLSDGSWKNKVRYTLTSNPLFKKKKADFGNCNVWFLDRAEPKNMKSHVLQSLYPKNFIFPQNENSKRISGRQKAIRTKPTSRKAIPLGEENIGDSCKHPSVSTDSFQQNMEMDSQYFVSQGWFQIDTGIYDSEAVNASIGPVEVCKIEPVEYYELEVPIITEYMIESPNYQDPMGVKYLLDDGTDAMNLEVI